MSRQLSPTRYYMRVVMMVKNEVRKLCSLSQTVALTQLLADSSRYSGFGGSKEGNQEVYYFDFFPSPPT
jgi:hypothetical protein